MNSKVIIGFVGEISAGKGTAVEYLEKKHNAASYRFSTPLRDVLDRLHIEVNRKNLQGLSFILRKEFGENLLAKTISEDAKNDKSKIVVIDGIRRPADIEYLEKLPEFKLVYITADIKIRYERLVKRDENRDDNNKTFEEFVEDHRAETETEIPKIGRTAGIKIDNNGDFKALHEQIEKILVD